LDKEELFKKAHDSVVNLDYDLSEEVFDTALSEKIDLTELIANGYSVGMQELGELFSSGDVFLPDLIIASEIMQIATAKIEKELLKTGGKKEKKGKVVMATVEGDIHDIGKGICCSMLKTSGIEVFDLGRDVPAEEIVSKAEEVDADIIGMSSLLTTSMPVQKQVINLLKEKNIRDKYKVMVGGAPVTKRWANKIGADAYTEDASECVVVAGELLQSR
jgi:trimethylamine corrinoid protein